MSLPRTSHLDIKNRKQKLVLGNLTRSNEGIWLEIYGLNRNAILLSTSSKADVGVDSCMGAGKWYLVSGFPACFCAFSNVLRKLREDLCVLLFERSYVR